MWTVYKHTNKENGKVYIGITGQPVERRWRGDGSGYKKCLLFYRAIQKYGWDNFTHEILHSGLTKKEAEDLEQKLIKKYKSNQKEFGYNIANGGSVHSISDETKKKISDTLKDNYVKENHPNYGKKYSDDFKKKLSEAHKGKFAGESHPNYGKKMSDEQKEKIRDTLLRKGIAPNKKAHEKAVNARRGSTNSDYWLSVIKEVRSIPVIQFDKDNNFIEEYKCITEAANKMGISGSNITAVCKGRRKYAAGYIWKYA